MRKSVLLLILLAFAGLYVRAQNIVTADSTGPIHRHLRISLLICTEGNLTWESFGHSTIRIIDSTKTGNDKDRIYNFGTFDNFEGSIVSKFLTGTMQVFLESAPYDIYYKSYVNASRGITEREFLLNDLQKDSILNFLTNNLLVENRYYNYDVCNDNCTTRIRDMFTKLFGSRVVFGRVSPPGVTYTYRTVGEAYCRYKPLLKLGMELFFSNIDKPLSNTEAMFLPSFLDTGMATATLDGRRLCTGKSLLLKDRLDPPSQVNYVFVMTLILFLVTAAGLIVPRLYAVGNILSAFAMIATGILGCAILVAWFFSGHYVCWNNYNVLWALPTNIIFPFLNPKWKTRYAIVAICLALLAIAIHMARIQVMPLFSFGPLLATLFLIYFIAYRRYRMVK